ncbi:MAG: methyltransferase domain-containing protein [Tistlia sp.]|uniref:methyltransferase domain-containing protein n=1 Tax=Tistlia sp. TaxID=3057121 RepID=UPI0034A2B7CE
MASENIKDWIEKNWRFVGSRVLEQGAKHYKDHSTLDLRAMFPKVERFVGMDLQDGGGVDVVCDLRSPFEEIDAAVQGKRFDTIFSISVMEHVDDIFTAARNTSRLLEEGGHLFISVPFVFRHHGYPSDYWRFTAEAVRFLFRDLDFESKELAERAWISTLEAGDRTRLPASFEKRNRFMHRPKETEARQERKAMKLQNAEGQDVEVPGYSLAPTMINMIGRKRSESA